MDRAEDTRNLAEDIVSSYNARIARIGAMKKETENLLAEFRTAHEKMSKELRKDLAEGASNRVSEVKNMLDQFQALHQEMSNALRDTLSKGRDTLSKGEKDRLAAFKDMDTGIKTRISEIEDETHRLLIDFDKTHKEMGDALRNTLSKSKEELSKSEEGRLKGFKAMNKEIKVSVDRIAKETAKLLREFGTAHKEMANEWKNLTALMAKKRGAPVKPVVKPRVTKPKPKVEEKVAPEVEEVKPEETLEEGILRIVNSNPGGIVLRDIADSLGLAPIRLARTIKALIDEGEIRKEDNLYYPAE